LLSLVTKGQLKTIECNALAGKLNVVYNAVRSSAQREISPQKNAGKTKIMGPLIVHFIINDILSPPTWPRPWPWPPWEKF